MPNRIFLAAAVAWLAVSPADALELRTAKGENTRIVIRADEVIEDNVLAAAETVVVEGTVNGNLLAFGREVQIRGDVQGDVLAAGQTIEASGAVGGNWVSFSRTLTSSARIVRSMVGFGERLDWSGSADGDLIGFASELALSGSAGKDAYLFGAEIEARGAIGGDLNAWTGRLEVGPGASIEGDLTAHVESEEQVSIDPGASIEGTTQTVIREERPGVSRFARPGFYAGWVIGFLAALATGLVLHWLLPGLLSWRMESPRGVAVAGGIGFLMLTATPFAALLAMITLVGVPVALMTMTLWLAAIYLAKIAVAPAIGATLLKQQDPPSDMGAFLRVLALGLAVFWVLRLIPILGGLTSFLVAIVGMGALGMRVHAMWRGSQAAQSNAGAGARSGPTDGPG